MTNKQTSSKWIEIFLKFSSAPIELKAYCLFATITTFLLPILLLGNNNLRQATVPITGWIIAPGYMFGLFFIYTLIFSTGIEIQKIKLRRAVIIPLAIYIVWGFFNLILFAINQNNFANPYLTFSKWQPIWTIIIPFLWIILLTSARVTKYCKA